MSKQDMIEDVVEKGCYTTEGDCVLYIRDVVDIINKHLEGKVIVPEKPDGDKGRLMGEFEESIIISCPECPDSDGVCELCGDELVYEEQVTISWTTIKDIREAILAPHKEQK